MLHSSPCKLPIVEVGSGLVVVVVGAMLSSEKIVSLCLEIKMRIWEGNQSSLCWRIFFLLVYQKGRECECVYICLYLNQLS